ncbi:MAG: hypothetical protein M1835_007947 [Candelina submexicana]|nr:MAG: hypothetical protein M1835_007947 [Candelina submexicana]
MEGNVPEIAHKEVGGPGSKGGGPRGAHKKWSGKGPTPARHIPWPEVFKHHISVVEGHTRMLEMIQKHTVPGTGNYNTITPMVERSKEMLRHSKAASRDFAPPAGQREKVPLGSSSVSMYPGYSPADIEYGKAAQEAGQVIAQVKASGGQWQPAPDGPQYSVGKVHGGKRKAMFQKPKDEERQDGDITQQTGTNDKAATNGDDKGGEGETLSFVVDTNPPPVNISDVGKKSNKRSSANPSPPEPVAKKSKKAKTKEEPKVDTEDISAEVDARMKDKDAKKEEKSKQKREEKKRKRSMDASDVAAASVDGAAEEPKSKKAKKLDGETEGKGKKKRRESEADADSDGKDSHGAEDGGKKKKRKKNKTAEGSD